MHEHIGSVARGTRHPERYTAPGPQSAETELADFLWGLVRLTHPDHVLETGTYLGHTTARLAEAVSANGHGLVTSVELDASRVGLVRQYLVERDLSQHVRILHGSYDTVDLKPPTGQYGVAFFDSHWERDLEYQAARPHLAKGALLVFHDCGEQHQGGQVRARVASLEARGLVKGLYIPCPRGVVVAQHAAAAL